MTPLCLKVIPMKGDGNCLFRSIADQVEGNQERYAFYRAEAVKAIQENKEYYKMFMDDETEDIDEYIEDMSKDATWGT